VRNLINWNFGRIVVGHGELIETEGKAQLANAPKEAGFFQTSAPLQHYKKSYS
jgi:hypothetical protein